MTAADTRPIQSKRRWRQDVSFEITMTVTVEAEDEEAAQDAMEEQLDLYCMAVDQCLPGHWRARVEAHNGTDLPQEAKP